MYVGGDIVAIAFAIDSDVVERLESVMNFLSRVPVFRGQLSWDFCTLLRLVRRLEDVEAWSAVQCACQSDKIAVPACLIRLAELKSRKLVKDLAFVFGQ